jgi:hypothetical protein
MANEKTQRDNQTRAQAAKILHERAAEKRAKDQALVAVEYRAAAESEDVVLEDIRKKLRGYIEYHTKMARDGVGIQKTGHVLENGEAEVETVFYTNEKRVSELDKAAGLLELSDYIDRQLTPPVSSVKK